MPQSEPLGMYSNLLSDATPEFVRWLAAQRLQEVMEDRDALRLGPEFIVPKWLYDQMELMDDG